LRLQVAQRTKRSKGGYSAILKDLAFAARSLICCIHGKIPDVAKALGVAKPPKWDGKVFDRVWQITFPQGKATLKDLPQTLLYGDPRRPDSGSKSENGISLAVRSLR
jgi:hypothetical protein